MENSTQEAVPSHAAEEEEKLFGDLFVDTDYKALTFEYKEHSQKIFALKTSATDYDLTGQIIWKAADIMSKYIIDELGEASLKGSTVLELGSGPGLCALIAQHWAKKVVLSDYQDLVMDLIEINMRDTVPLNSECQLLSAKLDWFKASTQDYYDNLPIHAIDGQSKALVEVARLGQMQFDYVIGSDIVYWTSSITPLMNVLTILFDRNRDSLNAFYFCYIERARETHRQLKEGMATAGLAEFGGFDIIEVASDFAKSIDPNAYIYKLTRRKSAQS